MHFRIEATKPTAAKDLKAVLEAARDAWSAKTPQDHPEGSPEAQALADAQNDIDQMRLQAKDDKGAALLAKAVSAHGALIKSQNANPNADHAGALGLINDGIAAAVAAAASHSAPVRASVVGHFRTTADPTKGLQGNHKRLSVHIDDATYG